MSKILIATFGTRGDIQPYIALGKGLQGAGYEVAVCTSEGFKPFMEEHHLTYLHMDNELLQLTQQALGEIGGLADSMRITSKMGGAIRRSMDDEWEAACTFEPDLIIHHSKCLGSYHAAEKLGIPAIMSVPLPLTPTNEFPNPLMSSLNLGGRVNRLSYRLNAFVNLMYGSTINDFRTKTVGLPRVGRFADLQTRADGTPVPTLYPFSQHLLPVPADYPPHVHVPGYWFLDRPADWQPDPALVDFLAADSPSIYVGFGSMSGKYASQQTAIILDALQQAGQRAVLARGWGGLEAADLPATVFLVESVPHDWLFPQMAAVVHHGGAGTTAAGLRAGKPSVICPFLGDQPFWGKLLHQRGLSPAPMPQRRLSAEGLAQAIQTAVSDQTMATRAAEMGAKIRAEDGIGHTVEIVERWLRSEKVKSKQ